MIAILFYIVIGYFLLGGVAIAVINRRNKTSKARDRWVKYVFYLLIVNGTIACIYFGYLQLLAILLLMVGMYEVSLAWIRDADRKPLALGAALLIFGLVGFGFYHHALEGTIDQLLYVYTIVFVFDGFAQISGQLLGNRKIFPRISPDKTVAGIIGGYISALLTSLLLIDVLHISLFPMLGMTLVIASAAMVGDLLASLWKRKCMIKDYSQLIPGHGGVLDRYDSYLLAAAVFWVFF